MNKERRKKIDAAIQKLESLREEMAEAQEMIEEIKDEEQDYLDNMPENLQGSERYSTAEEAIMNLESAYDWFDGVDFDYATSALEEAKGN